MSAPGDSTVKDELSVPEVNLLLLLESAGTTLHRPDGSVLWALDADDMCELLELAVELSRLPRILRS